MIYIPFDRSRRELDEKCRRARYWGYEYQDHGLESRKLNQYLLFGGAFHDAMAEVMGEVQETDHMPRRILVDAAIESSIVRMRTAVNQRGLEQPLIVIEPDQPDPYTGDLFSPPPSSLDWLLDHYADLLEALVRGWIMVRLPEVLKLYRVVEVEEEKQYLIPVDADHTLLFLSRIDAHLQRRSDGAHVVLNFKTTKEARGWWLDQWQIDQQTISECLPLEFETGQPVAGVLIEGIVKGREGTEWPRNSGLKHHSSPLVWAWHKEADGFEPEEWASRYAWTGDDGKNHRLGKGWYLTKVHESFPGGIPAWLYWLEKNDPELLRQQFPSPPLVSRQGGEMEEWLEQVKLREFTIYQQREHDNVELAAMFPKSTHNANCLFPSRCQFYDLCWGSAGEDPIGCGLYQIRQPNHPEELKHVEQQTS